MCAGSEDRGYSSINPSPQQSQSAEAATAKPGHHPEASKIKTTTSLPEESGGSAQHRPDLYYPKAKGPPQSVDAPTAHFRKFDTIMRSGVSVQELRSRFLLQFDSSAALKEPKEAAAAATIWQPGPLPVGQTSPRDEALQKLGLLQGNSSVPSRGSPPVSRRSHQNHISLAERLNRESAPVSFSSTGEPIYAHTMVTVQKCELPQAGAEH